MLYTNSTDNHANAGSDVADHMEDNISRATISTFDAAGNNVYMVLLSTLMGLLTKFKRNKCIKYGHDNVWNPVGCIVQCRRCYSIYGNVLGDPANWHEYGVYYMGG